MKKFWNEMGDLVVFLAVVVGGTFVVVAAMAGGAQYLDKYKCEARASAMHLPYEWSFWGGCIVHTATGSIPLEDFRKRSIPNEQNINLKVAP